MRQHIVPQKSAGGIGKRVAPVEGITAGEAAKSFFDVARDVRFVGPLMAVGREDAAAVEVIEQHEVLGQLVLVGRHLFTVDAQSGVTFRTSDVSKHLIVRAVLFDDVQHVLEDRRLAVPLWDHSQLGPRRGGERR